MPPLLWGLQYSDFSPCTGIKGIINVENIYFYIYITMSISALQFQREEGELLVLLLRPHTSQPQSPATMRGHLRLQLTTACGAQWWKAPHLTRTWPGSLTPDPSPLLRHGLEGNVSHLAEQRTQSPRAPFHPGSPPTSQPPVNLPVSFSEFQDTV